MPYQIVPYYSGFRVKEKGEQKYFSNHPLSYEMAVRQLRALYVHANPKNEELKIKDHVITKKNKPKEVIEKKIEKKEIIPIKEEKKEIEKPIQKKEKKEKEHKDIEHKLITLNDLKQYMDYQKTKII